MAYNWNHIFLLLKQILHLLCQLFRLQSSRKCQLLNLYIDLATMHVSKIIEFMSSLVRCICFMWPSDKFGMGNQFKVDYSFMCIAKGHKRQNWTWSHICRVWAFFLQIVILINKTRLDTDVIRVPLLNQTVTSAISLGKVLYSHCLVPLRGLNTVVHMVPYKQLT